MCHKPLKGSRHQIVRGDQKITVGPECFKKEKAAAERLANPAFQSFKEWMKETKGGARKCPAGEFPDNFKYWCEGGRW
jgi:ribosome-binding protein aMBF1 (putative translation factor)